MNHKNLVLGQSEIVGQVKEAQASIAQLQQGEDATQAHFAKVDEGLAALAAHQAQVDKDFEELRSLLQAKTQLGTEMSQSADQAEAKADKKRKVEQAGASGAAPSASPWGGVSSQFGNAGLPLRPSPGQWVQRGAADATGSGPPGQAQSQAGLRCRVVVQRPPQIMRSRLPQLMPELIVFGGSGLVRTQGPAS